MSFCSWLPTTRMAKKGSNIVYQKNKVFFFSFYKSSENNVIMTFHFDFLRDQTLQLIIERYMSKMVAVIVMRSLVIKVLKKRFWGGRLLLHNTAGFEVTFLLSNKFYDKKFQGLSPWVLGNLFFRIHLEDCFCILKAGVIITATLWMLKEKLRKCREQICR